jgi:glycosyltransferase involved in cell wall biosynthesis
MSKIIVDRSKGIIVVNNRLKEKYKELFGVNDEKILVARNGINIEKFDIKEKKQIYREEFNLPVNKKIIGYVGRLETLGQGKGADILIQAIKIIEKDKNDVLLCFVGGPIKRIRQYQDFAKKIGLEQKNIIFVNQVKHKLIPRYLKSFDILVMPFPRTEHYIYYMSPLKLFEYMASKIPIIASDLPSVREILNEQNSVLVEPDNPERLSQGIRKILEDDGLAEKISNQAFQDVQKYTWQKRAEQILGFVKENLI